MVMVRPLEVAAEDGVGVTVIVVIVAAAAAASIPGGTTSYTIIMCFRLRSRYSRTRLPRRSNL